MGGWTKEQLDAINAEGMGIIVSAAAGSGKTSVLVERLLRILSDTENKIPADRLVVVTFTNDAAEQMKQRLSAALSDKIAKEPDNLWLCGQQAMLRTAKISTIHSFCFDLIRENIQSADISAGFRILDDMEETLLMRRAVENTFEKFYSERQEETEELSDFFSGSSRDDSELEEVLLRLYNFLISVPFYEDWLSERIDFYSAGFDPESDPLAAAYLNRLESAYKRILAWAEHIRKEFERSLGRSSKAIESDIEIVRRLLYGLCEDTDWNSRTAGFELEFERFDAPRGLDDEGKAVKDKLLKLRSGYKKELETLCGSVYSAEDINDDYKKHAEILRGLFDMTVSFAEELRRLKTEKNALGFSDAEQLAVKLLAKKDESGNIVKTALARELSDYYSVIMIDEFQDANNNQDLIFKLLSKGGTAERSGSNLFVVGDVKQSIYRFRQANPRLFLNALEQSEKYSGEDFSGGAAAIPLNKNFRSSEDVIGFVNYTFGLLMGKSVGEVDYTDEEALVRGLEYPDADRTTEIIIAPCGGTAQDDAVSETSEDSEPESEGADTAVCEAAAAAAKIRSMLGVKTVLDGGEERLCEPRDFCILLRNNTRADLYVRALADAGVTAYAEEPAGYLRSREISVLTSLLAVVDNPMQDIPLVTALMSPMFMLTAEDMAQLAAVKNSEDKYFGTVKLVLGGETEISSDSALYAKLERFMKTFEKLRCCAAAQRTERFIRTIYDSTDFLSAVQVFADGGRKRANLRLLLDIAESYEKNSGGGLSGFVRYIDTIVRRGGDFKRASVVSPNENAVSVKTIHKSKGLEYPFVFLCGTSVRFNASDINRRMQINPYFGIGFKIQDRKKLKLYDSFPREVLKEINRSDAKSEEMRLLYVALTRAREQLFITIPSCERTENRISALRSEIAAAGGVTEAAAAEAISMLDWISMAMMVHPDGERFRGGETIPLKSCGTKVRVCMAETPVNGGSEIRETKRAQPDEDSVRMLEDMFAFRYNGELTKKSAKITVTEISKSGDGERLYLRRPEFAAERGGLTAAEKGTAMHTFMQYADYSAAEFDPAAEAERLAENGLLAPEERDSLNIGQLAVFFRSDLYERMKKSGSVRREQKFLIKKSDAALDDTRLMEYNSNSMIQGIADCMFEEDGELVLVDYKTDRVTNAETLLSRYDLQLKLYSAAIGRIFGRRVKEAYLYSFSLGRAVRAK